MHRLNGKIKYLSKARLIVYKRRNRATLSEVLIKTNSIVLTSSIIKHIELAS